MNINYLIFSRTLFFNIIVVNFPRPQENYIFVGLWHKSNFVNGLCGEHIDGRLKLDNKEQSTLDALVESPTKDWKQHLQQHMMQIPLMDATNAKEDLMSIRQFKWVLNKRIWAPFLPHSNLLHNVTLRDAHRFMYHKSSFLGQHFISQLW